MQIVELCKLDAHSFAAGRVRQQCSPESGCLLKAKTGCPCPEYECECGKACGYRVVGTTTQDSLRYADFTLTCACGHTSPWYCTLREPVVVRCVVCGLNLLVRPYLTSG